MPKTALIFAVSLVVAGAATTAAALLLWSSNSAGAFLICTGLAVLGATLKVPDPGMTGSSCPSVVLVQFAIGTMSWQEAVIISAVPGFTQCLWRPRHRPTSLQVLFNGANFALSSGLAYAIAHSVAASTPLLLFLIAAIVFQLVDTLSVSTILSLLEHASVRGLWRNCHLWSFPYIVAGGGFAATWAQTPMRSNWSVAVLCAIMLYMMSTFYEQVVARACRASSPSPDA